MHRPSSAKGPRFAAARYPPRAGGGAQHRVGGEWFPPDTQRLAGGGAQHRAGGEWFPPETQRLGGGSTEPRAGRQGRPALESPSMDPQALVDAALGAREHAYAPYSKYRVGAAVLAESSRVYLGCNVENASYGLTVCAERAAVLSAVSTGERVVTALAVVTEDGATPCGACRQVLVEFCRDARVFVAKPDGTFRETTLAALLPQAFRRDSR